MILMYLLIYFKLICVLFYDYIAMHLTLWKQNSVIFLIIFVYKTTQYIVLHNLMSITIS